MAFIPKGEHMLRKLREARDEEGFTLIELLVVVIIIGILAAIAIPVFLNQRERAYVSAAESDARNAAIEIESYFAETDGYPADQIFPAGTQTALGSGQVSTSSNVNVELKVDTGGQAYTLYSCHTLVETSCTDPEANPTATYDSDAGGLQ